MQAKKEEFGMKWAPLARMLGIWNDILTHFWKYCQEWR